MKKLIVALFSIALLAGCAGGSEAVTVTSETAKDENGNYASAEVVMKDGKIESITLDEFSSGSSKKELGSNYNMKSASTIGKEWDEQVKFLEEYIVANGIEAVELTAEGYAAKDDVLAGCTINITSMMQAANDAAAKAK